MSPLQLQITSYTWLKSTINFTYFYTPIWGSCFYFRMEFPKEAEEAYRRRGHQCILKDKSHVQNRFKLAPLLHHMLTYKRKGWKKKGKRKKQGQSINYYFLLSTTIKNICRVNVHNICFKLIHLCKRNNRLMIYNFILKRIDLLKLSIGQTPTKSQTLH